MQIEEAIEYLKIRNEKYKSHKEQIDLVTDIYGTENVKEYHKKQEAIETVLNELEKQQAEIENLKEEEMLDKADIEEIFRLRKENEKKDKVIDEMVEYIVPLDVDEDICKNREDCEDERTLCSECIKEYFYKKVSTNK